MEKRKGEIGMKETQSVSQNLKQTSGEQIVIIRENELNDFVNRHLKKGTRIIVEFASSESEGGCDES